jgi:hypothetical protein
LSIKFDLFFAQFSLFLPSIYGIIAMKKGVKSLVIAYTNVTILPLSTALFTPAARAPE